MSHPPKTEALEERILILAPTPRDTQLCCQMLTSNGFSCAPCAGMVQLCACLDEGAGAALLTEEAFASEESARLLHWLLHQPAWSDFPLLFLTHGGADSPEAHRGMDLLGNVILLERPIRIATLVSAARVALRGRQRQYTTRGHLEKLRHAVDAAEAATRAKSEFLANMSHEIRTPMTVFMAAIEHLLQIDRSPERRHLLGMAEQSAQRLRSLIDDILDISRIEARKVEIEVKPFDLRATVRAAVELFTLSAREKNLRLEVDIAPETPAMVTGDPDKIGQVLINLLGNAVKFTHQGEVRVCVHPRSAFMEFAVADTGIGIPEDKQPLLFQSFSQVDASFTRQYGGTGLGLAISKGLVELMGGEIAVQSRAGAGSVFTFTVPLRTVDRPGAPVAAVPAEEVQKETPAARILLAEDEPMIREMITMMLTQRGLHPDTAESGRQALEKWQDGAFDLILMDLQMPDMSGLEATQAIRQRENGGRKRTCIIGLTAHASRDVREQCLEAGMDQVLTKPVKIKDLLSAVDTCL
jgi:signal transduction histidine kinase/CheY-like chemotaxis protein